MNLESGVQNQQLSLIQRFAFRHVGEFAVHLERVPVAEAASLIETMQPEIVARTLEVMTPGSAIVLLDNLSDQAFRAVCEQLDPVRLAVLMARLDPEWRGIRLGFLPESLSNEVRQLMNYPNNSAGSIMDARVLAFREELSVKEVEDRLRSQKLPAIWSVCVIDSAGAFLGLVPISSILTEEDETKIGQLIQGKRVSVSTTASKDEVVELLEAEKIPALPVVDIDGKLVGIIRYAMLIQAVQQDAATDIQTMVGVSAEERALSPISFSVKKRVPWLTVNLGTTFVAAFVVSLFEDTLAKITALAVLLPIVAGQSGNTGAQALAVTMRGLALREVRVKQWVRLVLKEGSVGLINGVIIGLFCAVAIWLWSSNPWLGFVIGISMIVAMFAAGVAGSAIPVILTALKQDPAQSSSIVLTTVTDVVGFLSFLGLATLLSKLLIQ